MKKLITIFLAVVLMVTMAVPAGAAEAVGKVDAFSNMPGDGQYINNKDHYQLDMVKPGILDSIRLVTNGAANLLFQFEVNLVNLTCTLLYYVSTIDFMNDGSLGTMIDGVQKNLYDNLFNNAFNLAFLFVGLFLAWLLLGRKYGEILNQLAKVLLVCFMAALLGTNTWWCIKMDEEITASFSDYVAAAITGSSSGNGYAVDVAGQIWSTQVHQPWLTLEFGEYDPNNKDQMVTQLLKNLPPDSKEREEQIKTWHDSSPDEVAFAESMRWERLVFTFLYLFPLLIKCLLVCAVVLLQLAFRVLKIFLYFLGIPVMLLSLVPQLGGTKIIESWIKKIFEMSFMIVILSFTLSVILWFDGILWTYAAQMGWLTVIILQMGVAVVIFMFRNKILGVMDTVQNVVRNPAPAAAQIREKMDSMGNVSSWAQRQDGRITQAVKSSEAYKGIESGAKDVLQSWNAGIGNALPDGNVFQKRAEEMEEERAEAADPAKYGRRKLMERQRVSDWDKATWDAELEKAGYSDVRAMSNQLAREMEREKKQKKDNRPRLVAENAADALKNEDLAAAAKENTGIVEDSRPQLRLYQNPDFVRDEESEQMPLPETVAQETPAEYKAAATPDVVIRSRETIDYEPARRVVRDGGSEQMPQLETDTQAAAAEYKTAATPDVVIRSHETTDYESARHGVANIEPENINAEAARNEQPRLNMFRTAEHGADAMPGEVLRSKLDAATEESIRIAESVKHSQYGAKAQDETAVKIRPNLETDALRAEPEKSVRIEKTKPAAAPQKRPARQASPETANITAGEKKGRTGQAGQGTVSDLGAGQRMTRETERTRPAKKRPALEQKPETAAQPVTSRDIIQDKKPASQKEKPRPVTREKLERGA